jgi:hypothetical protein
MSNDDSFIREVNEELRQDQAKALWDSYGPYIIGIAVIAVLATAAWVGWDYWTSSKANASGDRFSQALQLAKDGQSDKALAELQALEKEGYGAYPVLARLRIATLMGAQNKPEDAVAGFDAVSKDSSVPVAIRDMARLRAAYILIDTGSYDDVASRVEELTADGNPLRHSAREALALAAWKAGRGDDALKLFEQIASDAAAPRNVQQRATLMAELIRGSAAGS